MAVSPRWKAPRRPGFQTRFQPLKFPEEEQHPSFLIIPPRSRASGPDQERLTGPPEVSISQIRKDCAFYYETFLPPLGAADPLRPEAGELTAARGSVA